TIEDTRWMSPPSAKMAAPVGEVLFIQVETSNSPSTACSRYRPPPRAMAPLPRHRERAPEAPTWDRYAPPPRSAWFSRNQTWSNRIWVALIAHSPPPKFWAKFDLNTT